MKGIAKLELFAANGSVLLRQEKQNVVTNWYKKSVEAYYQTLRMPGVNNCYTTAEWKPAPIDFTRGLLLFGDSISTNADDLIIDKPIVAYAGNVAGSAGDSLRGNYNSVESGSITDGYRHVWDFATDKANVTIAALGLATELQGNGAHINTGGSYPLQIISEKTHLIGTTNNMLLGERHVSGVGMWKLASGVLSLYSQIAAPFMTGEWWAPSASYDFNATYDNFSSAIEVWDTAIWFIARKKADTKYYLVKVHLDDGSVLQEFDLSAKVTSARWAFSFIPGFCYIYHSNDASNISLQCFDLSAGTFDASTTDIPYQRQYGSTRAVYMSNFSQGMLITSVNTQTRAASAADVSVIYNDKTVYRLLARSDFYAVSSSGSSFTQGEGNFLKTEAPFLSVFAAEYGYGIRRLGIVPCCLFSRLNLDTPITKTSAQTLKVTYQITW